MARRKKHAMKVKEDLAANVIPMVDIMFLLVLFFMLAADMSQKDLEVVELPQAAKIIDEKAEKEESPLDTRVTINIVHKDITSCPAMAQRAANPNISPKNELVCRIPGHWKFRMKAVDYGDEEIKKVKDLEEDLKGFRDEYNKRQIDSGKQAVPTSGGAQKPSEMRVMIRADRAAPFGFVQRAMAVCGKLLLYKVQVGAAKLESAK